MSDSRSNMGSGECCRNDIIKEAEDVTYKKTESDALY